MVPGKFEKLEVNPWKVAAYAVMSHRTWDALRAGPLKGSDVTRLDYLAAESFGVDIRFEEFVADGHVGLYNKAGQLLGLLAVRA